MTDQRFFNVFTAIPAIFFILVIVVNPGEAVGQNEVASAKYEAEANSQTKPVLSSKVKALSLNLNNVSLEEAIRLLEERTNYRFSYSSESLSSESRVTMSIQGETPEEALHKFVEEAGITYEVSESGHVIPKKHAEQRGQQAQEDNAMQHVVSGVVTSANDGSALPGVNILVKGTTLGTVTDQEGQYELEAPAPTDTLIFSYVGYLQQEIPIEEREEINVELEEDIAGLEEIIVVGYGTVERADLTGSVERVSAEQFQGQSMTQVTDMLTGTVAGLNINQGTEASGEADDLEIRGPNSLTANTEPLIVLDGVIYNGRLRDINPQDVESIDVLKDASSAAVYGARAASGVVIINTTKGQEGPPSINFASRIGMTSVNSDEYAVRGPEEYIDFRANLFRSQENLPDYYWNNPSDLPEGVSLEDWRNLNPSSHPDDTQEWLGRLGFFPTEIEQYLSGETVNWADVVMNRGLQLETDLSVSGGSDNIRYYWSLGYRDNEGIVRGDEFSTIRSRINVDFQAADWLNVGINAQYANRDESSVPASINYMQMASPFGRVYDSDGILNHYVHDFSLALNPLINTSYQDKKNISNSIFASIYGEISLPHGFSHRVAFQPRVGGFRDYNFWPPETEVGRSGGLANRVDYSEFEWMLDNILSWNKDIGNHSFDLTLLHNVEVNKTWLSNMSNERFAPSPVLGYSGIQFGTQDMTVEANDTRETGDAIMARLNYTLLDKYLFTASVRRDGYSAFGQDRPRATFPAGAFAWQISNEDFFDVDWISNLKLRLSWGVNGNREIGAYSALGQLASNQYYDGTSVLQGVYTNRLSNPDLQWEETRSTNVGLDMDLFGGRVGLNIDYYDMTTDNLLVSRQLPWVTGFESVTTNIGELSNKGFEMGLRTVNWSSADLRWRSSFNVSLNRNNIVSLFGDSGSYTLLGEQHEGEVPDFDNNWFPGQSIDVIWDYEIIGIWQEDEAEEAAEYGLQPGDIKARDVNGDGSYTALQDKRFIGHSQPRYRFGLRNEVSYKNLSASIFIRSDLGHIRQFGPATAGTSTYDRRNTAPFPYWTSENQSNEWPRLDHNQSPFGGGISFYKDASFVRIQDVTLNYNAPSSLVEILGVRGIQLSSSIRNLYSFDNWPGWDPESLFNPMPRTITFGVDLSL